MWVCSFGSAIEGWAGRSSYARSYSLSVHALSRLCLTARCRAAFAFRAGVSGVVRMLSRLFVWESRWREVGFRRSFLSWCTLTCAVAYDTMHIALPAMDACACELASWELITVARRRVTLRWACNTSIICYLRLCFFSYENFGPSDGRAKLCPQRFLFNGEEKHDEKSSRNNDMIFLTVRTK